MANKQVGIAYGMCVGCRRRCGPLKENRCLGCRNLRATPFVEFSFPEHHIPLKLCPFCQGVSIAAYKKSCKKCKKKAKNVSKKPKRTKPYVSRARFVENTFYDTREWQDVRYRALKLHGRKCMVCFQTNTELHVDHIKPRSLYPHLELEITNLQILCRACNMGKSNKDEIDWRAG